MGILNFFKSFNTDMNSEELSNITESLQMSKAFTPMNLDLQKSEPTREPRTYFENPLSLLDATGYKDKPFSLSYDVLRQMATRNAVIGSVITTRVNQVSAFTKPARFSNDGVGYKIRTRNPNTVPSDEQKRVILALEMFLENCGFDNDPDRDGFDTFVRKLVRDSLTYDQGCFEVVPDRKGRPAEFYAVDSSTIRAASDKYKPEVDEFKMLDVDSVKWVQVINGAIKAAFSSRELAFGVRNPRTDINLQPYGFSELEQLIHQITSHLYAEEYNSRFFSQGGTTKGILNIKTDPMSADREQIESFKRQWRAQVSGLYGAWKTPILQVPQGLEYINVSQSNREMEFEKWMNYLINVSCAVFQIDPAEVNFPNNGGAGGGGGSVFEGSNEARLKNSKDKGLRPLLRFIETLINKYLIQPFSDEFVFNFVGIDSKTDKEVADLDGQSVRVYKTVNEIRAEHDMKPIDGGDIILDGVYVQMKMQQQQMEQQQQMMAMQGDNSEQEQPEQVSQTPDNEDTDEENSPPFSEDDYVDDPPEMNPPNSQDFETNTDEDAQKSITPSQIMKITID